MIKQFRQYLAERERQQQLEEWRLGYMHGVANRVFPGMFPEDRVTHNMDASAHWSNGYAWAMNNPVAVTLPPHMRTPV
jgi:hypothetical protein